MSQSPKPLYGRAILIYLLAIVMPALALLYFGIESFQRQRQAVDSLIRSNLRLSGEKLAAELERRTTQLAESCLRDAGKDGTRNDVRQHPIERYVFVIERGQVMYPRLHTPPALSVDELLAHEAIKVRQDYAAQFRQAEFDELRENKIDVALAGYRKLSAMRVADPLRALALQRVARCLEKMNHGSEARQFYEVLARKYGDLTDPSHRPYALVSALALHAPAARKLELWREIARGRWELSAEQIEYFAPLLGGSVDAGSLPYMDQLQFARALEEQFRLNGILHPGEVYSFAFNAQRAQYQTFYKLVDRNDERVLGFAVDLGWVQNQLLSQSRADLKIDAMARIIGNDEAQKTAGFSTLFPFWGLVLIPPHPHQRGGPVLQAAITGLILCLLLMGIVLLIRDLSRSARLNQLRADFVGAVSHELKTPITVIRLYGETLLEDEDFSPAERREFYQIITRESDRLSQLIEKVLAFSKIDRGEKQYHLEQAELSPVVSRTVDVYEPYLNRRGFSIQTQLSPALPPVRFDADAVSQALVNLLDNAAKYSGESKSIAVRSYAVNGSAVLEVEDHGIGIPQDEQQKIFERFYRVPNGAAKGGYGLGLYLVRHIMDAHSGRVELESEPQRGSRFRLIFPAVDTGSQA